MLHRSALAAEQGNDQVRYEPDDPCPLAVSVIAGFQGVLLVLTPMVTAVTTTALVAGQSEDYLIWAAFAALLICGVITALQAGRVWRFGTGHVLLTAASVSLIVVSVPALLAGGPGLLSAVIVAGALSQFALSAWLPLLRRIITPVVTGTALMLLAATVIPIAAGRVTVLSGDDASFSGPVVALITLVALAALSLRVSGGWRLWVPLIAIGMGCIAAIPFGLYDFQLVAQAPWVGIPGVWFPDFEVPEVSAFVALLPMAVIVVMINGIKNMGDSVVVQRLSRRDPPATDYRLVQGSLNANGLGVLLSGLAGSPPTTINSATSGSLVSLTGVASRKVGYVAGIMLIALAFSPKLTATLLSYSRPGHGSLPVGGYGNLCGGRHPHRQSGRAGSEEGADGGAGFFLWSRSGELRYHRKSAGQRLAAILGQRVDCGNRRCGADDMACGTHWPKSQAAASQIRPGRLAGDRRIPAGYCGREQMGR